ncbi:hypothetical protein [Marivirga sp.]|uniref:hypothetical protein n=1 Tax=Marivirga sp. TaxID=2018662 RepID=UPI0025F413A8|nr:hypothetical protein [Marivirga sp.]
MKILTKKNKFKVVKTLAVTLAMGATVLFTSCDSSSENLENAKEDVYEAKEDLNEAQKEYAEEVKQFRAEAERKINENERKLSEINAKIKNSENELNEDNEKQIVVLEQRNKDLKIKMAEYEPKSRENWSSFRAEFKRDLDRLGTSLKDFTIED